MVVRSLSTQLGLVVQRRRLVALRLRQLHALVGLISFGAAARELVGLTSVGHLRVRAVVLILVSVIALQFPQLVAAQS